MKIGNTLRSPGGLLAGALIAAWPPANSPAAGVTLVTHGFNGTVTEWVIPMVNAMAVHPGMQGANSTCYEISFSVNGSGVLVPASQRIGGVAPLTSVSGEIFIKLNWSSYSGGAYSTTQIANAVTPALLDPNFIPELGGHALVELPLHLVGHSRGASVISELTRLLGAQGVWVDHVTSLDPRPVSQFGDPTVRTYESVLFADDFWQNLGDGLFVPNGQTNGGAYNRQLTNLTGGYSSSHSDTHLWYHGTINLATPASDTQTNITATMRTIWWTPAEAAGASNGFFLSRIGGGDRLSSVEPAGAGKGRIRDGFNQKWDLGAGVNTNRTALPANNGAWPNLLRSDVTGASTISVDDPVALNVYFQFGQTAPLNTVIEVFLDADGNPFNGTTAVAQFTDTGTGTANVKLDNLGFNANPAAVVPGVYSVAVRITGNGHARWLYAPQRLTITPSRQAPRLTPLSFGNDELHLLLEGLPGQIVVVQNSTNLADWFDQQTNTLTAPAIEVVDPGAMLLDWRFYRARLAP